MAKPRSHAANQRAAFRLFRLFGEPTRVIIFQRLTRKPQTAGDLAKELPISRTAIVQHLKLLEAAGLVAAQADGKRLLYRPESAGLSPLRDWLALHSPSAHKDGKLHKK